MNIAYSIYYIIAYPFAKLIYPCRTLGKENISDGPLIVCSNHSDYLDVVELAMAFGFRRRLFFMAKAEFFKIPVIRTIFKWGGVFPIERGEADITAIRTTINHLKNGHIIMMFPEGTRVSESDSIAAKSGAVRIASKLKVQILPIYITKNKKPFHKAKLIVGKPYIPEVPKNKDYTILSDDLMKRIYALEPLQ